MPYLIDTNMVIHARDGHERVLERLFTPSGAILLSALSPADVQRGFSPNHPQAALRRARLEAWLPRLPVLESGHEAAEAYGRILATLGWVRGRDFDRLIAAQALVSRAVLLTANMADFQDVPDLTLENGIE